MNEEAEATPLETLMDSTTLDEIQEDRAVGNGVEDGMEYAAPGGFRSGIGSCERAGDAGTIKSM